MALLDDMKLVLRLSGDTLDAEVGMTIDAALGELGRVGVDAAYLDAGELAAPGSDYSKLVKMAVADYCRATFAKDVPERDFFMGCFNRCEIDLLNSAASPSISERLGGE